jgi:hypothetical protein
MKENELGNCIEIVKIYMKNYATDINSEYYWF